MRIALTCIMVTLSLAGCASINSKQASALNQSVTATDQNLSTALTTAQDIDVQTQITALATKDPAASGKDDPEVIEVSLISDKTKQVLLSQFTALSEYTAVLAKLTGAQTSFATSVGGLNKALSKASTDASSLAQTTTGTPLLTTAQAKTVQSDLTTVSSVFAAIGQSAINLYADHQAFEIATKANPAIQNYCSLLQQTLCIDPDNLPLTGLNGIVWDAYNTRVNDLESVYFDSAPAIKAPPAKKPDVESYDDYANDKFQYLTRTQQRTALLMEITQLRQQWPKDTSTILALRKAIGQIAQAHQALVDRKSESFADEIGAAITTLQNMASYYNSGSSGSTSSGTSTSSQ